MEKVSFFSNEVDDSQWTPAANNAATELQKFLGHWYEKHGEDFSIRTLEYIANHAVVEESMRQIVLKQRTHRRI